VPYDLRIELPRAARRDAIEAALRGVAGVGPGLVVEGTAAALRLRRGWLGRVRAVEASLPWGRPRAEAEAFGRVVRDAARALGGTVRDEVLGAALPPGVEAEWIVDTWAEVDPRAGEVEAEAAPVDTAPRSPAELVARLRAGPLDEAEEAVEALAGALDELDPTALEEAVVVLVERARAAPALDAPGLEALLARGAARPGGAAAALRLLARGGARHAAAAAEALAAARVPAAAPALVARLVGPAGAPVAEGDDVDEVPEEALARALARLDPGAFERLAGALEGARDPRARARLLGALATVDAARAVPLLVEAIGRAGDGPCPDAADEVLETFVTDPAALPALRAQADDPRPAVRRAVAAALRWFEDG
jgi:hypothetical protein